MDMTDSIISKISTGIERKKVNSGNKIDQSNEKHSKENLNDGKLNELHLEIKDNAQIEIIEPIFKENETKIKNIEEKNEQNNDITNINYIKNLETIEKMNNTFSIDCIYCSNKILISIPKNDSNDSNINIDKIKGINIRCPYRTCLQYFYITKCPQCKTEKYIKIYIYEGDLIKCENCRYKYIQTRCPFENCDEFFCFCAPLVFNHSPLGMICKHKQNNYFQKLSCFSCLRPLVFFLDQDKKKRYFEGQKITCCYENCNYTFNRLICPNCNKVNIIDSGTYIMGSRIKCFFCNNYFGKMLCIKCLNISTLENEFYKYGEWRCRSPNCGSIVSMANCLFCRRLNYFQNDIKRGKFLIQGRKIQCGYADCNQKFNIASCPNCHELNPFPKGDFIFGKLYKCIYGNCSKLFTISLCPTCFTFSRTIEEVEGRKYDCNICNTHLSNYGCPYCKISILDKISSFILGQIIQCPNPFCRGKFSFCRCIDCKRLIYLKEDKTIIGKKVVCEFCGSKTINIFCYECQKRISIPVTSSNSFDNGEKIECPNCKKEFIYDKKRAIIIKNEKGEDINLEKDIYYKNLSYIDEIKGTPIQFGEPSVDKNYLKMEESIMAYNLNSESNDNKMTITNDSDRDIDIIKNIKKFRCIICQSEEKKSIFYPCGHRCCCNKCAMYFFKVYEKCPKCDIKPEAVIRKIFI